LAAINESSQTVNNMSYQISSSAQEQSAVAHNISEELSGIRLQSDTVRELTTQSSQGVAQLSQASENLGKVLARYQTGK